ncbi:hypothetical protein BKA80DRAFT_260415 [Phyllosticta citrichinensis]
MASGEGKTGVNRARRLGPHVVGARQHDSLAEASRRCCRRGRETAMARVGSRQSRVRCGSVLLGLQI